MWKYFCTKGKVIAVQHSKEKVEYTTNIIHCSFKAMGEQVKGFRDPGRNFDSLVPKPVAKEL